MDEQATIERAKALYASGMGQLRIAHQLDAEGLRSKFGKPWSSHMVGSILRRSGVFTAYPGPALAAPRVEDPAPKDASVIALAKTGCETCNGLGRQDGGAVCHCVHHRVFNTVMAKFRYCAVTVWPAPRRFDHFINSSARPNSGHRMMNQDFVADVHLAAKRTLTAEDFKLFRYRYCLGADARLCARQLGMTPESCVQRLQAIEARLGQAFRNMRPYALYPLDQYFHARIPGGVRPCARGLRSGSSRPEVHYARPLPRAP